MSDLHLVDQWIALKTKPEREQQKAQVAVYQWLKIRAVHGWGWH
jgi:hypothetical protein